MTTFAWLSSLSRCSSTRRYATTLSTSDYSFTANSKRTNNPFPFPQHPRPTPYEIFHLPVGASLTAIKSRYYDLVRYHHPDSPHARSHTSCPNERKSRFQTIISAYNTLQNPSFARSAVRGTWGVGPSFDPYMAELNRRRRTSQNAEHLKQRRRTMDDEQRHREQEDWNKSKGSLRERIMITLGVAALLGGLYPSFFLYPFHREKTHQAAVNNLRKARNEAQEVGHLRREEMRRRLKSMEASKHSEETQAVEA